MQEKETLILKQCFHDTINWINSDSFLKKQTYKTIKGSKVYEEKFCLPHFYDNRNAEIIVEENTTFAAAQKHMIYYEFEKRMKRKTAVLNFANPHNPGGTVAYGGIAQEECLCRSSNLYPTLITQEAFDKFYNYHMSKTDFVFSDRIIYSPCVTVFKTDEAIPKIMEPENWFQVDVMTSAAPYVKDQKYTNKAILQELFENRIENIFNVARENHVEVLILGAFGCGEFGNPPEVVAKAFHNVIERYKQYFIKIVFAIKKSENSIACSNITAFKSEFNGITQELYKKRVVEGENRLYDEKNYSYTGKQFSILGDSISTLEEFNPRGYKVFYEDNTCKKTGVCEMMDTWWGQVVNFFGGELLVNNSWSGSRVTKLPDREELFPSGCSDERTSLLHMNSIYPDEIIVYLGTNDWAFGVTSELCDTCLDDNVNLETFSFAYELMLDKLIKNYPKSEIWCCTLCETVMSENPYFKFPHSYGGTHIEEYNKLIKRAVVSKNCRLIDLYQYHTPYDSFDGSHPTANGMSTLASMIISQMTGEDILPQEYICT